MTIRMAKDHELNLQLVPHGHLAAMADGRGDEDAYCTVVFRTLVGHSLVELADESGKEALLKVFLPALDSAIAVGERYKRLGKFGLNGDELTSLKAGLNLTDDLQAASTRREQLKMYQQVRDFVGGVEFTINNLRNLREQHK